jgi:hypothetical protein
LTFEKRTDKAGEGYRLAFQFLLVCLVPPLVLFSPRLIGDLYVPGSDAGLFYFWALQFGEGLESGLWYPRWAWTSHGGLGAPVFLYYPPVYFHVTWIVKSVVGDLWWAMAIVDALAVSALALVSSTLVARVGVRGWGLAVTVAAVASTPFAYMSVVYVQGLPWHLAYPAMLAVIGVFCAWSRPGAPLIAATALAVGLLALTHVLSVFMVLVCLAAAGSWALLISRRADRRREFRRWVDLGTGSLLGLVISAVYLWPALTTLRLSNEGSYLRDVDWRTGFALPVWTSGEVGARWGFFQWWIAGLIVLSAAVATLGLAVLRRDRGRLWMVAARAVAAAWVAILLSSDLAYPLWAVSPTLQKLQYPYRFFCVGTLAATLAAGLVLVLAHRQRGRVGWLRLIVAAPLAASLVATTAIGVKFAVVDGVPSNRAFDFSADVHGAKTYMSATTGPRWRDYLESGGFEGACRDAGARCRPVVAEPQRREWRVSSPSPWRARLPVFAFPAWRLWLDDEETDWDIDAETGVITARLPAGTTTIGLRWVGLPEERTGRWLSIGGCLIWIALAGWSLRYRRTSTQRPKGAETQSTHPPV